MHTTVLADRVVGDPPCKRSAAPCASDLRQINQSINQPFIDPATLGVSAQVCFSAQELGEQRPGVSRIVRSDVEIEPLHPLDWGSSSSAAYDPAYPLGPGEPAVLPGHDAVGISIGRTTQGAQAQRISPRAFAIPMRDGNVRVGFGQQSALRLSGDPSSGLLGGGSSKTKAQVQPINSSDFRQVMREFREALDGAGGSDAARLASAHSARRRMNENGMFGRYGLVARSEQTGKPVGLAVLRVPSEGETCFELESIATVPGTRGVGRLLVASALNDACADGQDRFAWVESFTEARGFYEALGFEKKEDGRYELHPEQRPGIWSRDASGAWY